MHKRPLALLATLLGAVALSACGATSKPSGDKLDVVVPAYPFQWVAERIGGDRINVTNLVKPGAEPHDVELTAKQTALITDASLVMYLPEFQPAVDEAVKQHAKSHAFDIAAVEPLAEASHEDEHDGDHAHHGKDPHLWLDPTRLATVADTLADRLAGIDPTHADGYKDRATALRTELEGLDTEYAARLQTCQRREIVTAHEAFGYLAARYNLTQVGISGLSPDEEPTAQRIAEIITEAKAHNAAVIFTETLISPKIAQTIADGAGVKTQVLDPIESAPKGGTADYTDIMRANLSQLTTALGCS
ncbi:MAG: zinc ABC transporter substrate-binding protein [Longispora sp.]|nr:zinc ABC transporter substrate-binding protein [Longispora sp. (in: high G+C Gram-positive bacteria)]